MAKLTTQYIEDHLVNIHTEDSWARTITEMVLRSAINRLGAGSSDEITIDVKFYIRAIEPEVLTAAGETTTVKCLKVCVGGDSGIMTCKHINVVI
ncbi:MAG: hypothetical protein JST85_00190 [Acidobacteria bacterium]|nr:hypothetical protein [Acidobacteriota bacterium]